MSMSKAAEREAMRKRSAIVQALDDWASERVGYPAPSPARMSATYSRAMTAELGRDVTHVILVPGFGERFALGADAARELAFRLLCEDT